MVTVATHGDQVPPRRVESSKRAAYATSLRMLSEGRRCRDGVRGRHSGSSITSSPSDAVIAAADEGSRRQAGGTALAMMSASIPDVITKRSVIIALSSRAALALHRVRRICGPLEEDL